MREGEKDSLLVDNEETDVDSVLIESNWLLSTLKNWTREYFEVDYDNKTPWTSTKTIQ
jgi:hypothetical protein